MKRIFLTLTLCCLLLCSFTLGKVVHWTFPHLPFVEAPVFASYTPTPIKSITNISIACTGCTTATQTVAVTKANSILVFTGNTTDEAAGTISGFWMYGTITNDTTVTATRASASPNIVYTATLVEYLGNFVKSEGCGSITIPADGSLTTDATVTAVTIAKTQLGYTGMDVNSAGGGGTLYMAKLTFNTTTTVRAARLVGSGTFSTTAGYCYLEFK
jgi:hypothetical protein